jgi:hypothetical protein
LNNFLFHFAYIKFNKYETHLQENNKNTNNFSLTYTIYKLKYYDRVENF